MQLQAEDVIATIDLYAYQRRFTAASDVIREAVKAEAEQVNKRLDGLEQGQKRIEQKLDREVHNFAEYLTRKDDEGREFIYNFR